MCALELMSKVFVFKVRGRREKYQPAIIGFKKERDFQAYRSEWPKLNNLVLKMQNTRCLLMSSYRWEGLVPSGLKFGSVFLLLGTCFRQSCSPLGRVARYHHTYPAVWIYQTVKHLFEFYPVLWWYVEKWVYS